LRNCRIYPISNAISDRYFEIERHAEPQTLLHVGSLCQRKGILELIEGLSRARRDVPDVKLRLAGAADDPGYSAAIQAMVQRHGLGAHVTVLGHVSDRELEAQYAVCSALVLASYEETAPIAIAQAMAANVPVLASMAGGIPHLVRHGETALLFEPGSAEGIAGAIRSFFAERKAAERRCRAARADAERRFRMDNVASQTAEVYDSLLDSNAMSSGKDVSVSWRS
jgi:glycogen(starch) synthase